MSFGRKSTAERDESNCVIDVPMLRDAQTEASDKDQVSFQNVNKASEAEWCNNFVLSEAVFEVN